MRLSATDVYEGSAGRDDVYPGCGLAFLLIMKRTLASVLAGAVPAREWTVRLQCGQAPSPHRITFRLAGHNFLSGCFVMAAPVAFQKRYDGIS